MIRHIVLFRLKDKSPENLELTKNILLSMEGKVQEIKAIEAGIDFLHSERSFDIALSVLLEDRAALEAYQNDPYHCSVVKKHMHAVREESVAADYEF